jgi:mono/diheme cytochrome c family protein
VPVVGAALAAVVFNGCGDDAEAELARGEQLYEMHCVACHGGATGGSMMEYPPRHNARGHTWHHSDCQLRDTIRNGSGPMGEMMRRMMAVPSDAPTMPAFRDRLSDEEVESVIVFIKTMWTEEQWRFQAQITREECPG